MFDVHAIYATHIMCARTKFFFLVFAIGPNGSMGQNNVNVLGKCFPCVAFVLEVFLCVWKQKVFGRMIYNNTNFIGSRSCDMFLQVSSFCENENVKIKRMNVSSVMRQ